MRHVKLMLSVMAAILLLSSVAFSATRELGVVTTPPQLAPYVLEGVISALDPITGSITLVFPNMPQRLPQGFFVSSATRILKNGQIAPFSALAIGDICRAEIRPTADNVPLAVSVMAKSPLPQLQVVRGKITAIDPTALTFSLFVINDANPKGITLAFIATKETVIRRNGAAVSFDNLKIDDLASVGFMPVASASPVAFIKAAVIEATSPTLPPAVLEGLITKIDLTAGSITLGPLPGTPARPAITFFVTDATKITRDGVETRLSGLVTGDACRAEVKPQSNVLVASVVQAKSAVPPPPVPIVIEGIIKEIDSANSAIVLGGPQGSTAPSITIYATSTTKIMKNDEPVTFSALRVGDFCRAEVKQSDNHYIAVSLRAKTIVTPPVVSVLEGAITKITPNSEGGGTVTLGPVPGAPIKPAVTFAVNAATVITKNGVAAKFSALLVGDICRAEVKMQNNAWLATKVDAKTPIILPPPVVVWEGPISAIDLAKSAVTLAPPTGSTLPSRIFFVTSTTKITRNGIVVPLSALVVGDMCRAEVVQKEGGWFANSVQATAVQPPLVWKSGKITAIDPTRMVFTITMVTATNPTAISMSFYADKDTKIKRNGVVVGFGDLKVSDLASVGYVQPLTMSTAPIRASSIEARSTL